MDSSAGSYELTLSTLQLHVAICCSQPSVTQEHMYIWILRSFPNPLCFFSLSVCQPADLHPAAVPVHVRESSQNLQTKPDQNQTTQRLAGLNQNLTRLTGQRKKRSDRTINFVSLFQLSDKAQA